MKPCAGGRWPYFARFRGGRFAGWRRLVPAASFTVPAETV